MVILPELIWVLQRETEYEVSPLASNGPGTVTVVMYPFPPDATFPAAVLPLKTTVIWQLAGDPPPANWVNWGCTLELNVPVTLNEPLASTEFGTVRLSRKVATGSKLPFDEAGAVLAGGVPEEV